MYIWSIAGGCFNISPEDSSSVVARKICNCLADKVVRASAGLAVLGMGKMVGEQILTLPSDSDEPTNNSIGLLVQQVAVGTGLIMSAASGLIVMRIFYTQISQYLFQPSEAQVITPWEESDSDTDDIEHANIYAEVGL